MQRAEFENKVQEKMQELRFRPSDEVWKHIEAGIEKRKRRTPAMIWMLAGALVLGGISYYFLNNSTRKSSIALKPVQQGQAIAEKQNQIEKKNQLTNEPSQEVHLSTEQTQVKRQPVLMSSETNKSRSDAGIENKRLNVSRRDKLPELQNENAFAAQPATDNNMFSVNRTMRSSFPFPMLVQLPLSNEYNNKKVDEQSGVISMSILSQKTVENPSLKRKQWRFGITAFAGVSDLGEQLFLGPTSAGLSYVPQTANSGGGTAGRHSDIKQGAAFSIGMYARKMIAAKWQLGTGISYQYFSNTIKVGEKVDSTVFLNQNNYSMDRVNQYYKSNGNSPYHNQYHFISLPVFIQWQFAKRFSWENQLVYSRMVYTNALHYDGANRAYYENKDLFNKNQFAASTAVLFGFNKNRIQVGPQLQYAFTNLLSDNNGTPKHLRSVSIKSTIDLWKN